jgi:hypothetical protein
MFILHCNHEFSAEYALVNTSYAANRQSKSRPRAAQPRMPIFTEGSIMHMTIYAVWNQEMSDELRNQSQKYIGEKTYGKNIHTTLPYYLATYNYSSHLYSLHFYLLLNPPPRPRSARCILSSAPYRSIFLSRLGFPYRTARSSLTSSKSFR